MHADPWTLEVASWQGSKWQMEIDRCSHGNKVVPAVPASINKQSQVRCMQAIDHQHLPDEPARMTCPFVQHFSSTRAKLEGSGNVQLIMTREQTLRTESHSEVTQKVRRLHKPPQSQFARYAGLLSAAVYDTVTLPGAWGTKGLALT